MTTKEHIGEWVAISDLKKWDKNPRDNSEAIKHVADSIQRFGFASPIIARKNGEIIAGHTRFEAAKLLKLDRVPVRYMDLDPADAKLLALADNKLAEIAEWNKPLLMDIFETEQFSLDDLNIAGFNLETMDELLGEPPDLDIGSDDDPGFIDERTEYDEIPDKIEPTTKTGETIEVGPHRVICGECVKVMKTFDDNSIDALVCDPPYGIDFMSKAWDRSTPNNQWAAECFRILKPGGHLIAFAATRTFHRLGMVVEQAGFEIRDTINWLYFSGFPKSHSVSKGIDSHFGAEREVIGKYSGASNIGKKSDGKLGYSPGKNYPKVDLLVEITAPSTPEAKQFDGYGTALKPAFEPAILARKPLSEKNIAENVLKWGTGGLNIDGSRFGYGDPCWVGPQEMPKPMTVSPKGMYQGLAGKTGNSFDCIPSEIGRWPANIFQCPKASRSEREEGCEELPTKTGFEAIGRKEGSKSIVGAGRTAEEVKNIHPTVKPIKLMRWLCRLVMPPTKDAVLLDTFAGSGSTLVAAELEGFASIGIEMNPEYCDIIVSRVKNAVKDDG